MPFPFLGIHSCVFHREDLVCFSTLEIWASVSHLKDSLFVRPLSGIDLALSLPQGITVLFPQLSDASLDLNQVKSYVCFVF